MGCNHVDAVVLEVVIEAIAVIGSVANEMLGVRLQHLEVETELDHGDFMMIGRMRTGGEGEPVPIDNRQNLHVLPAFREADGLAAALGGGERGIDETLPFVEHPVVAQGVRQLGQHLAQDLLLTPLLEATMDLFVIRIALRQEVPLRAGVQNPEDCFQEGASRDRLTAGATVRNPLPLIVAYPQHEGDL